MKNISDHDLLQMDEAWQDKLPEPKIRNLLKRTLEDLRVARDRLNQNPGNSSRPSGSMPPWVGGDDKTKDADKALMDKQDEYAGQHKNLQDDDTAAPEPAKDTKSVSDNNAAGAAGADDISTAMAAPAAKRAGRPEGAPGFGRTQKLTPTKFVYKHPQVCTGCLRPFTANDPAQAWTAWDTLELRALSEDDTSAHQLGAYLEVTRYYLMRCQCICGHITQAQAQRADDDKAQWVGVHIGEQRLLGPRLAATVVYLSLRMRLPRLKVQELLLELFGLEVSTALIDQTIKQTARSVEPLQPELVRQLQEAVLAHADETSWPERTLRLWLWVFCCSHTALYVIGARTKEMFESALGSGFAGTLMSDGYQAYRSTVNRLRCWAHLQRKLRGVAESTDTQAAANGRAMLDLFGSLMQGVFEARDKVKALPTGVHDDPPAHPVVTHAKQVEELKALCEKHRDAKHEGLRAIAREFLYDWEAIMRVLADSQLPLTNNAAERQLRHWVIARRISYGTRNLVGSNSLALLASVIDTCRLRGASATDLLARAIHAARQGLPAPALPSIPTQLLGRNGALMCV
jgi:transposase